MTDTIQIQFETELFSYVRQLYHGAVVSTSHHALRKLNERYNSERVSAALMVVLRQADAGRRVLCVNFEETDSETAHVLYDVVDGRSIGQLQPVDHNAVNAAPGIQAWSKP
jgi:hypothetical protein